MLCAQAARRAHLKKELNRGRWEVRETKVFRVEDGVELGFPGARTEKFAEIVRTHCYVEVYHGKRDNGYHEDVLTRRCDESLMSAAKVARSFGMWICARRTEKTTEQVKRGLWERPSKLVRIMLKGGLL